MTDRMHQPIEGLTGIEIIADDFLVCGSGKSAKEALANHDKDLHSFLEYAGDQGLKLNIEKVKLPLMSVPFIGHLLTDKGFSPDLEKVADITNIPTLTDTKLLQEFLGVIQYLSKFLPQLSTITEPLRQLIHKDMEWKWLQVDDDAMAKLKELICKYCNAQVLKYFDTTKEITLQCDASESGLVYALMQESQPIAFGAQGLTPAERNYVQIEKMFAIVADCEKFDQYIYRHKVVVETNHKPLVSISTKPFHNTPKRLQWVLLHVQRYNLVITYKKGKKCI